MSRIYLFWGMGVESNAILTRWLTDPTSRDFSLEELTVITAQTGDEHIDTKTYCETHILPLARSGRFEEDGIDDTSPIIGPFRELKIRLLKLSGPKPPRHPYFNYLHTKEPSVSHAKAQGARKPLETRQRFAPLRLCARDLLRTSTFRAKPSQPNKKTVNYELSSINELRDNNYTATGSSKQPLPI